MVSGNARQYLRTFRRKGNAMKKTALDDDAYLYQKREEKTEKEKWSEMNRHQRMQYFLDYYLVKLLVFTGIILAVVLFVWNFISKSKEDTVLYVAVVDEVLQTEGTEKLKEELTEYLGADGKYRKIIIDDSFYMDDGGLEKLEVYLYNKQIDVVIADEAVYKELAGYGFFQDISTVPGVSSKYADLYVKAAGYKDEDTDKDTDSFGDHSTAKGEELPYGVDISASRISDIKTKIQMPVLSIAQGAENMENAVKLLDFIYKQR